MDNEEEQSLRGSPCRQKWRWTGTQYRPMCILSTNHRMQHGAYLTANGGATQIKLLKLSGLGLVVLGCGHYAWPYRADHLHG
jgi:hypothetical protein